MFQVALSELPEDANTIEDFRIGVDKLSIKNIDGIHSFDDLTLVQDDDDVVVYFEDKAIVVLEDHDAEDFAAAAFLIEPPVTALNPADFVAIVDNEYLPLLSGSHRVYEGITEDGLERIVIDILHETREIMGIQSTIQRDVVYIDGVLKEDTLDLFA